MTGGRLQVDLQPAGTVVQAFEVLDAVNRGLLDAGHSWPGFWTGKHPAATLFGSAPGGPYGMNSEDYPGWIYLGGGLELYNELLQKELKMNVVVFPTFGETPAAGVVPEAAEVGRRPQGAQVPRHRDRGGSLQGARHGGGQHRPR